MSSFPRNSESTPLLQHDFASRSDALDDVDERSLDLDLAEVQSIPHGGEVEPGFPPAPYAEGPPDTLEETSVKHSDHFIDVSPTQFWVIFAGVLFSYIIAFFDSTLMGSIHPVVTSHFGAANSASWLSTGFLLTCTAFQPLFGRVSDTFGRRPVYLFSIFMFLVTTAWCALAQSMGSFIAARVCCGLGAGGVTALGMIMSSDLIYVEYRGIYQSYINLAYGTGQSLGLAFGGLLADSLGWRAAFSVQLPFIFVHLVAAYFTTPLHLDRTLFISVESKAQRPVMPLPLLSSFPHANLIFGNFFANITINTILFNAPLYFQAVKLESPTNAGFRLVAASITLMISSVLCGCLITVTRRLKPPLLLGSICLICGTFSMSQLHKDVSGWKGMLSIIPSGLGQGLAFPATTLCLLAVSSQADQAVVTTTIGLFRNLGSVMGVAISSWILQNSLLTYLHRSVTGEDRAEIIERVRKSVTAIHELDLVHQKQGCLDCGGDSQVDVRPGAMTLAKA
ncbi:hypothetical protein PRK78_003179 [Emydomyces testavorans]|uniref:Major facilitator superfamily (MFS) profile domain-containing protein n=1 Tax=Emydomyces testavorans TaxID=2070801 RepID=A0AAF0DHN3_9EURO|nr:hypothetical protein PRK78_003179 [Emydomyces testavorans]